MVIPETGCFHLPVDLGDSRLEFGVLKETPEGPPVDDQDAPSAAVSLLSSYLRSLAAKKYSKHRDHHTDRRNQPRRPTERTHHSAPGDIAGDDPLFADS